jgi:hypothetical protein
MTPLNWLKKLNGLWEGVAPGRERQLAPDGSATGGPTAWVRESAGGWQWKLVSFMLVLGRRLPCGESPTLEEAKRAAEKAFPTLQDWERDCQESQRVRSQVKGKPPS